MAGIWSLTPDQVYEANTAPPPPEDETWLLTVGDEEIELQEADGETGNDCRKLSVMQSGEEYILDVEGEQRELDAEALREELVRRTAYVPSLGNIVDSMEAFEAAKDAGKGAIAMTRSTTLVVDDVEVDLARDRMWVEATY